MEGRATSTIKRLVYGNHPPQENRNFIFDVGGMAVHPYRITKIVENESVLDELGYFEYDIYAIRIPDSILKSNKDRAIQEKEAKEFTAQNVENGVLWQKRTSRPDGIVYFYEGEELV